MGYFSNGTEGEGFVDNWCANCAHWTEPDDPKQCTIWMLHLCYNGEQHNSGMVKISKNLSMHGPTLKEMLGDLIRRETATRGQECTMYLPRYTPVVSGGESWCPSFRHHQPMEERNSGAPCLLCLTEGEIAHA